MITTTTSTRTCCCGEKTPCDCPKCTGLECLERPRFFAGQLLTEAELTAEQDYHRAKQRLHNLHLHGWGVVCGLEVVCHECPGWVLVQPGYAIDPCGEDVIVCREHPLNVAEMIRDCKKARRRPVDCDPRRPREPRKPTSEHWCITLRYAEQESKPITALRREGCDVCGCGPGCTCSCPCHGEEKRGGGRRESWGEGFGARAPQARRGVGKTVAPCEPTRILETYCLEVCEAPEDYCDHYKSEAERAWHGKFEACVEGLRKTFGKAPMQSFATLVAVQLDDLQIRNQLGVNKNQWTPALLHDSFCKMHDFLYELLRRNPGNLHCSLLDRLAELECPTPGQDEGLNDYLSRYSKPSNALLGYLWLYLVDCICWALLPPCAPCCPGEDELILACMEISEDEDGGIHIEHICNTSCRRYAGAFPPTVGGIHLGPIWPLIARVIDLFCCGNLFDRLFSFAKGSENGRLIANFTLQDNFSRPRYVFDRAREVSLTDFLGATPTQGLNLTALVSQPPSQVLAAAEQAGVEVQVHEVEALPALALLHALPAAAPGERLIAYSREGKVVGFAQSGSTAAMLVDQGRELADLRKEIETLRGGG